MESTTIIGIPTAWVSRGLVYHTPWDTVEHIQTAAVEAVLDISINYVLRKDHEAGYTNPKVRYTGSLANM